MFAYVFYRALVEAIQGGRQPHHVVDTQKDMPHNHPQMPALTADAARIPCVDTFDTRSLYCMWRVFSKCADYVEDGRRLENFMWRLWAFETFCVKPHCSCRILLHAEMPPLSTFVDSTAPGGEKEGIRPQIRPSKTQNDIRRWRGKHIMPTYLTRTITTIKLLPAPPKFSPPNWRVFSSSTFACASAFHSSATVAEHNVSTANTQSQQKTLPGKRECGIFCQHGSPTQGLVEHPAGNQTATSSIDSGKNPVESRTSKQTKRDDNDAIETEEEDVWEDSTENSQPSVDEKLFQRIEPIRASRRSHLTAMMRQKHDIPNSRSLGTAQSPRTARRNMISKELPKQLRAHLLTERRQNRSVLLNMPQGPSQSSHDAQSTPGNEVFGCSIRVW